MLRTATAVCYFLGHYGQRGGVCFLKFGKKSMDNDFLDHVLNSIKAKGSPYFNELEVEYEGDKTIFKFKDAIQYLIGNEYLISTQVGSQSKLHVTPKGQKLLLDGGFVGEAGYKKDILKYSKDSRDYARKAYYIAIAGIIVSILLFFLSNI